MRRFFISPVGLSVRTWHTHIYISDPLQNTFEYNYFLPRNWIKYFPETESSPSTSLSRTIAGRHRISVSLSLSNLINQFVREHNSALYLSVKGGVEER